MVGDSGIYPLAAPDSKARHMQESDPVDHDFIETTDLVLTLTSLALRQTSSSDDPEQNN